ncbi:MAG: rhodanese-like domain-containing protein [Anaerolineaceae bacterium]|nr:rhodanese-like domain-containing protein [Anaerolineaceae bacterium]
MSFLSLFFGKGITREVEDLKRIPGAVLLDVRAEDEYRTGHIPGGINIPVERIANIEEIVDDRETPVFVYCLRGTRSRRAVGILRNLGYTNVKSIGGIASYKGELEK